LDVPEKEDETFGEGGYELEQLEEYYEQVDFYEDDEQPEMEMLLPAHQSIRDVLREEFLTFKKGFLPLILDLVGLVRSFQFGCCGTVGIARRFWSTS